MYANTHSFPKNMFVLQLFFDLWKIQISLFLLKLLLALLEPLNRRIIAKIWFAGLESMSSWGMFANSTSEHSTAPKLSPENKNLLQ